MSSSSVAQDTQSEMRWCSACHNTRNLHEFDLKRNSAERKKTCRRHGKKAAQSQASITWDMLIARLRQFSLSAESRLEFVDEISLDSLPAHIGDTTRGEGKESSLTRVMGDLLERINGLSPWRFWNKRTKFRHEKHPAYVDNSVAHFIEERIRFSPSKIFQLIQGPDSGDLPGKYIVSRWQVYRLWQNANAINWRRAPDVFDSAIILVNELGEKEKIFVSSMFTYMNMRCVAVYIDSLIDKIGPNNIRELAMDATYDTNNKSMDLFAVMAEFEGTGVPIAYGFVEVIGCHEQQVQASQQARFSQPSQTPRLQAMQGALTDILNLFLLPIADRGINPQIFHTDKDTAEIQAIRKVYPQTRIQLCNWHALRAIRTKLESATKTAVQARYDPEEAA
ncbi:hypothetical protein AAP_04985 [Ascosphaera apis ARSEF 7405]|uniref:MULE transposase domain-containing protein n=1 Tax=Ascosphaera apis ARSEF 7405 TaxID=392613 RepID=A0A162I4A3_9EURO|nr:hypothetical protein AAP_04985 [Ascosphaera apis ARSEF 7405]